MKHFICHLIFLLLLSMPLSAATLSGKATVDGDAVPGVRVMAYPLSTLDFNEPTVTSSATLADGLFRLDLPSGEYYLLARSEGRYNFYGRNPIAVSEQGLDDVNLLMLEDNLPVPENDSDVVTGVAGFVSVNGQPVPGAVAMVYTDLSDQLKGRGLGWISPSDEHGYFEAPLPAGHYYIVVRVRKGGKMAGPLQAGDLFGYLVGNPLLVKEGELARVHIPLIEVPDKVKRRAATLFGNTAISGRILNSQGAPVAGLQVLLYDDPMMLSRPLYVSQRTDVDGRFQLSFPQGGQYYLAARSELGGIPAPGELYGRYQGTPDHSIQVDADNSLDNIEIVVEEVY